MWYVMWEHNPPFNSFTSKIFGGRGGWLCKAWCNINTVGSNVLEYGMHVSTVKL